MKSLFEKIYFILVFSEVTFAISGIAGWGQADDRSDVVSNNPILVASTLMVVLGTIYLAAPRLGQLWRMFLQLRWTFLLYTWLVVAIMWSEERPASLIATLRLLVYLVSAGYLALRYDIDDILRLFSRACIAAAWLSIPGQRLIPHSAMEETAGWEGIFGQKNILGFCMMTGVIILLMQRERWNLRRAGSVVLCATLLLLSQSYTAIMTTIITALFILSQKVESRVKVLLCLALAGAVCIGFVISDPLSILLSAGGKDSSLTGRDAVWAFALNGIIKHPFLGYGYNAFWSDSNWTLQSLHWSPPHAHNALLQIWLDLGIVGVVLTCGLMVNSWRRARRLQKFDNSLAGPWMLTLLVMAFVHNITESDLVSVKLVWYLIMLGSFSILRVENEARQQAELIRWQNLKVGADLVTA